MYSLGFVVMVGAIGYHTNLMMWYTKIKRKKKLPTAVLSLSCYYLLLFVNLLNEQVLMLFSPPSTHKEEVHQHSNWIFSKSSLQCNWFSNNEKIVSQLLLRTWSVSFIPKIIISKDQRFLNCYCFAELFIDEHDSLCKHEKSVFTFIWRNFVSLKLFLSLFIFSIFHSKKNTWLFN